MRWFRLALLALVGVPVAARVSDARPCAAARRQGTYDQEIAAATRSVANIWAVPDSLVKSVIKRESGFRPRALSRARAVGLMQVMPFNARRLGMTSADLWDPGQNILAGTRLLAVLLRHYEGDVISALVAYSARPRKHLAPIPANGETPGYIHGVLRPWKVFQRCEK